MRRRLRVWSRMLGDGVVSNKPPAAPKQSGPAPLVSSITVRACLCPCACMVWIGDRKNWWQRGGHIAACDFLFINERVSAAGQLSAPDQRFEVIQDQSAPLSAASSTLTRLSASLMADSATVSVNNKLHSRFRINLSFSPSKYFSSRPSAGLAAESRT